MEKIYYQGKKIEVTGPEYDSIVGTLMIEGMLSGLKGEVLTPEESRKVTDKVIGEILKKRKEI